MRGPVTYYVLFFIHFYTRRVHIAGMTSNPGGAWMAQIARNVRMFFAEQPAEFLAYATSPATCDTKFAAVFSSILETDGIVFRPIPPRSPCLSPHAEVWVSRMKAECLQSSHRLPRKALAQSFKMWLTHYHCQCPHRGLSNVPIDTALPSPAPLHNFPLGRCRLPRLPWWVAETLPTGAAQTLDVDSSLTSVSRYAMSSVFQFLRFAFQVLGAHRWKVASHSASFSAATLAVLLILGWRHFEPCRLLSGDII